MRVVGVLSILRKFNEQLSCSQGLSNKNNEKAGPSHQCASSSSSIDSEISYSQPEVTAHEYEISETDFNGALLIAQRSFETALAIIERSEDVNRNKQKL